MICNWFKGSALRDLFKLLIGNETREGFVKLPVGFDRFKKRKCWACSSAWLERTPDKREVDSSNLSRPTTYRRRPYPGFPSKVYTKEFCNITRRAKVE